MISAVRLAVVRIGVLVQGMEWRALLRLGAAWKAQVRHAAVRCDVVRALKGAGMVSYAMARMGLVRSGRVRRGSLWIALARRGVFGFGSGSFGSRSGLVMRAVVGRSALW